MLGDCFYGAKLFTNKAGKKIIFLKANKKMLNAF